jgi:hypothetical protein
MALPRLRVSISRMMIGVAVVALLLWCSLMVPRVTRYRQRLAEVFDWESRFHRDRIYCEARSIRLASEGDLELSHRYADSSNKLRLMENWASEIKRMYEQALWCPWLDLPPEPPPPVSNL